MEFYRKNYCRGKMVTQLDMLDARERRAYRQRSILQKQEGVLVCLTLNIPGAIKVFRESVEIFDIGTRLLEKALEGKGYEPLFSHTDEHHTGYVHYMLIDADSGEGVKETCVDLEENHLLGRIFDIDVFDGKGVAVSRQSLGYGPRKCILCGNTGHECARNSSHTIGSLIDEIILRLRAYQKLNSQDSKAETDTRFNSEVFI